MVPYSLVHFPSCLFVDPLILLLLLQALRLFRLAAELEHKASALKAEALQHLFIALAGSDCRELWTLLVQFFGKGTGFDPFDFLDAAPAIKAPLDLGDTDSDDDAASSVSLGSTSTTASTASSISVSAADAAQASTSQTPAPSRPKIKPKAKLPDIVSSVDDAEGFIPRSFDSLHSTGIPREVRMQRSGTTTSKGSSLYICPHPTCGATPYIGDLYGCSSHLRRAHYGTCLACPYCPTQKYYRVSGWKKHMASSHPTAPWYGASEITQATLMLQSLQEEVSAPSTTTQEAPDKPSEVGFRLPTQEEISTVPLKPTVVDEPPEESLPYTVDVEEGDEVVISLNLAPEEEQKLLGDVEEKEEVPPSHTPGSATDPEASVTSDTRQYVYARNVQGTMESRYLVSGSAIASGEPKLPPSSDDPSGPPPPKKSKAKK